MLSLSQLDLLPTLRTFQAAFERANYASIIDIVLVAILLYSLYLIIRETRALRIVSGIALLGLLYILAQALHLATLIFLLQSVFTMILVAIPIVFQPELRAALERLGRGELVRNLLVSPKDQTAKIIPQITNAVLELASHRTGALIVIEQKTDLDDLVSGGVRLDAEVSAELLLTIFKPGTALHDGAVIIRGERVAAASVYLPLAEDIMHFSLGTRHRAALGLSKECDAVIVVVSEETGKVSIAHQARLNAIKNTEVEHRLKHLAQPKSRI